MVNYRTGQKAVLIKWKPETLALVDASLAHMGYSERSQFIRDAVVEKLEGIQVLPPNVGTHFPLDGPRPPAQAGGRGPGAKA